MRNWLVVAFIVLTCLLTWPVWAIDASNILMVANTKVEGSVKIAEHYAAARGIDAKRILKIEASDIEEIDRKEYDETVLAPIAKVVREDSAILCLVLTRGVPLKVKATDSSKPMTERDWASVDGELSLLLQGGHAIAGWIENPLFNKEDAFDRTHNILIVTRLDGPTVDDALALIDKAILAEALGPEGKSFLDTRGMTANDGYGERDTHMRTVADAWKALSLEYDHDDKGPVVDLSERESGLHYYGWYDGNPSKWKGAPAFRTGAIGIHLHSFAASTLRNTKQNWVAPLLAWGVTATYGTVYEPFTVGFPYEGIFWDRLAKGMTFGEAGLYSNRLFSWQATFVGDPLYRPYPKDAAATRKAARERMVAAVSEHKSDGAKPAEAKAPEGGVPPVEAAAILVLQRWIVGVEETAKKDDAAGVAAFAALVFRTQGWGLDAAIGKRLPGVDKAAKKLWAGMKAALKKDASDTVEYERALVEWRGLAVHAELEAYREELGKAQEKEAAKLVKAAEKELGKDATVLKAWQSANEAAAYRMCESGAAGLKLRAKIEAEKTVLLADQANKALEPHATKFAKIGKKGLSDKDRTAIAKLIATHPVCAQRKVLEDLVG